MMRGDISLSSINFYVIFHLLTTGFSNLFLFDLDRKPNITPLDLTSQNRIAFSFFYLAVASEVKCRGLCLGVSSAAVALS